MSSVRGRDSLGRWQPGQSGNKKGRPSREREREYLDVTISRCSPDEWGEVIDIAFAQAKEGDARAREWLARYLLGDPVQVHEYLFEKKQEILIRVQFGEDHPLLEEGETVEAEYTVEVVDGSGSKDKSQKTT